MRLLNLKKKDREEPINSTNAVSIAPTGSDARVMAEFQQMQQKNEIAEVLKELFNSEKILMMTDLSMDEIKLATSIYILAEMKDIKYWKKGIEFYMKLVLSKNRKSRREILEAIKGYSAPQSLISKMNPMNWNRNR
jgi:predicted DNA-binding protein YlxM (UPF0122 family)